MDGGPESANKDRVAKERQNLAFASTRQALVAALGDIDGILPGSIVVRQMRCGRPGCSCKADPSTLHGPYIQWTRTVEGKTVTRYLKQEQLARYQRWFDNAARAKELLANLETVSVAAVEEAEGWTIPAPTKTAARRRRPTRST